MAVDPSYPLYPIATISIAGLQLLLSTTFTQQSWNNGVAFLSFWLFLENLTWGINAVLWKDNADIKAYVYCDIVSRIQMAAVISKPACTLIISRRLFKIASLRKVEAPSKRERSLDRALEWTLGFILPIIVAGPLYYIVEESRFEVDEGFGCSNAPMLSILELLFIASWQIAFSSISVIFYCPKVIRIFYLHRKETMRFLRTNNTVSSTRYLRILAIGSLDAILTFPFSITLLILAVRGYEQEHHARLPFYQGFDVVHADWTPTAVPYSHFVNRGTWEVAHQYFEQWTSPVLGLAIFALFGCTAQARSIYLSHLSAIGKCFGWKPKSTTRLELGKIDFHKPSFVITDAELGKCPSFVASYVEGREASLTTDISTISERFSGAQEHAIITPFKGGKYEPSPFEKVDGVVANDAVDEMQSESSLPDIPAQRSLVQAEAV